ncbi:MAG TPA: response regulator transcription factor [Amnibacterium sp.]|nr:response regulator transcription factor [Amnibacterium sp.]
MKTVRVLLAEDHPLYRAGLRLMLEGAPDLEVVGEAASVPELLTEIGATDADVVVLDVAMPGGDGIDAIRALHERRPGLAVLILTMFDDAGSARRAMRAGASGYLVKGASGDDVLAAVRAVGAGQVVIDGQVRDALEHEPAGLLTVRERDVLRLMASGLTNTAIAERLFLSEKTVRNHVSAVFRKLGAGNRVDAVRLARHAGLG